MTNRKHYPHQRGAALITLLVITAASILIIGALAMMLLGTMQSATSYAHTQEVYYAAEAGIENALLRLLRNPSYTGEELTIAGMTVTIEVTGTDPIEITSVAQSATGLQRTVTASITYATGALEVVSWKEE